ncbi:hypothetical protein ACQ27_gp246 [Klebsiella phage K64-1]|uniref:Uncharacterized protein n=1 Tax=Klebsiella phage vB_KleM_RaK2 TaxID=1147094 RepID=H6X410_9CAUD|nr:hypothetical protein F403_gp332 [Klebsiella phage vB_KleM_RaK2]YP_010843130.1 hypothetical protein ACQ27_gp246 [Klebsiella phage K64-1]AFA44476.1 hypothetical protein RaK2_00203 [Klebsiella phage vB_KleM_RaK2]
MKQYAIKYKPNGKIISLYNTKEAALERCKFIGGDSNVFGVFEVFVYFDRYDSSYEWIGVVLKSNNTVLNIFADTGEISNSCQYLIKNKHCYTKKVQIRTNGKEIKAPKVKKDEFSFED